MKNIIKASKKILMIYKLLCRLNIIKTIYINFKTQPFRTAVRFPIFLYGKYDKLLIKGEIIIDNPKLRSGMIKVGYKYIDRFPVSLLPNQLIICGKLIAKGNLVIGGGVNLTVAIPKAIITFGENCTIGGGSLIKSVLKISIGNNVQITGECIIMDSEMHYVKNIDTGQVNRKTGVIIIGNNCWINQRSVIAKNTIIPDFCIVARNSFLNEDYTTYGQNLLLVGSPAKPKKQHVQRIFNINEDKKINDFFEKEKDLDYIIKDAGLIENDYNNCSLFYWYI